MNFQKKTCKYCGLPIGKKEHGNRIRCKECSAIHHRDTSKYRQRIIRQLGNQGLKNLTIIETITLKHNWEFEFITNIQKLITKGFSFSQGGYTHNTDDLAFPRVFIVIKFEIHYNPVGKSSNSSTKAQLAVIKLKNDKKI